MVKIICHAKRRRITKQIRIVVDLHEKLSELSQKKNFTLSKTIEKICRQYFNNEIR